LFFYECETWFLRLREKHDLRVFENRVLRKILESKPYEVTGEWRRLHNGEVYDMYSSQNIIRTIKSNTYNEGSATCRTYGERRSAYRLLVGVPERKRRLGRPRRRREDNIKMGLQEVGWEMDWIDLDQDKNRWPAVVNAVMKLMVS
jgi:hypothetical protein